MGFYYQNTWTRTIIFSYKFQTQLVTLGLVKLMEKVSPFNTLIYVQTVLLHDRQGNVIKRKSKFCESYRLLFYKKRCNGKITKKWRFS